MKPTQFFEYKMYKRWHKLWEQKYEAYLERHPEIITFDIPRTYYFRILNDRCQIHWAVIKEENGKFIVYFINLRGQAFDKLEFKTKKQAQRGLRRSHFYFSTNKKCPYEPMQPIYIKLCSGRKSAPYSKGILWNPPVKVLPTKEERIKHYKEGLIPKLSINETKFDKYFRLFVMITCLIFFLIAVICTAF